MQARIDLLETEVKSQSDQCTQQSEFISELQKASSKKDKLISELKSEQLEAAVWFLFVSPFRIPDFS